MWTEVRDQIQTILLEVEGVHIVHPYPRLARDRQPHKWLTWMRDHQRINAWTISREGVESSFLTCKEVQTFTRVVLVGMLQHDDETQTQDEFDNLVDTVLTKFYVNYRLNDRVDIQGPADLRLVELHQVGDQAVHYAEIVFSVQQRVRID